MRLYPLIMTPHTEWSTPSGIAVWFFGGAGVLAEGGNSTEELAYRTALDDARGGT